jgi:hypothetical protein
MKSTLQSEKLSMATKDYFYGLNDKTNIFAG